MSNAAPYQKLDVDPLKPPPRSNKLLHSLVSILLILLIPLLVICTTVSVVLGAAYYPDKLPFISTQTRMALNKLLMKTPLPRNVDHVVIGIAESDFKILEFQQDLFIDVSTQGIPSDAPLAGQAGLRLTGPINYQGVNAPGFNQKFSFFADVVPLEEIQASGEVKYIEEKAFVKVDSLPNQLIEDTLPSLTISHYLDQWYDLQLNDQIPVLTDFFSDYLSEEKTLDPSEISRLLREYLRRFDPFEHIQLIGIETFPDHDAYHLVIVKTGTELAVLASDFIDWINPHLQQYTIDNQPINQELKDTIIATTGNIEKLQFDLWVHSEKYYPLRANCQIQVLFSEESINAINGLLSLLGSSIPDSTGLKVHLGWQTSGINSPQFISSPGTSIEVDELLQDLFAATQLPLIEEQISTDLTAIATGLEDYYALNKSYPDSLQSLVDGDLLPTYFIAEDSVFEYYSDGKSAVVIGNVIGLNNTTVKHLGYDTQRDVIEVFTQEQIITYQAQYAE